LTKTKIFTSAAKISISYPPLDSPKGSPFLGQNRQFQWTNTGNVILPVIPAFGATALKKLGFKVYWDDAIAEKISYKTWLKRLIKRGPDIIFIESKTPVIKKHWSIIKDIKKHLKKSIIVLMGDHLTALPRESFGNCPVDYVLTGGDYDFMMISLLNHLTQKTPLEPGFYYRQGKKILNSGPFSLIHHRLDDLPQIDRQLTHWQLYGHNNTNFKYKPGAYIMSGRDCWWGKCTFCSWTTTHPAGTFRTFSVKHVIGEINSLVNLGIKEIFDDTGTFPVGSWLKEFCQQMIDTGLNKKVVLGCNMRFAALNQEQYNLMAKAGFRFLLFGLESSNQETLDRICKNTKVDDARKSLILAKKAGLEPHLTIMIGYPWEDETMTQKTLTYAKTLFQEGLADSLQATIVIPYPGTPLFTECQKKGWLLTTNWDDYDMRQPIMKSPLSSQTQLLLVKNIFKGILTPRFIFRKILSIRNIDDLKYLWTYAVKYFQKLKDFPTN
jgi:radical SAM superfamily enzyme YgiQ (UPF0313 family)